MGLLNKMFSAVGLTTVALEREFAERNSLAYESYVRFQRYVGSKNKTLKSKKPSLILDFLKKEGGFSVDEISKSLLNRFGSLDTETSVGM